MEDKQRRFGWRLIVFCILVLFIVIIYGYLFKKKVVPKKIRNVLLVSIDTCRADYLSCYGYPRKTTPNIDAVAEESVLFENAFSTVPLTLPAHSSMLTGTIPPYHGVHDNYDYQLDESNITLAEILKKNGFATGAVVSTVVLDSKLGIDQGFDTYNDDFKNPMVGKHLMDERSGGETTDIALDWLNENKDKKFFYFAHYFDPHVTYKPPEPFATRFASNPYAGEIAYVDDCIGRVINKLKHLDIYDSTLIIITADHGEMLDEHGERTHGYFIYQGGVKVPLLFKLPGQNKPVRIKSNASLVDIVPTVCNLLNIEISSAVQGINLLSHSGRKAPALSKRDLYCESLWATKYNANSLLGLISKNFKYIQTTRPELYDLARDAAEENNLVKKQPQRARIMQDKLAQILEQSIRKDPAGSKMEIDDKLRKRLESLGYISGTITEDFSFDQTKEDPKDVLDYHLLYKDSESRMFILKGEAESRTAKLKDYEKIKKLAQEMILLKPDFYLGYSQMGELAIIQKNYPEAIEFYNKAIKLKPDEATFYEQASIAYYFLENYDEAIRLCRKGLELKPIAKAYQNLGTILKAQGKIDEAIKYYNIALQEEPAMAEAHYNLGVINLTLKNQPKQALADFQNALKYDPDSANAIVKIAATAYMANPLAEGKIDQTITLFELIVKNVPDCFMAHYNLGLILQKAGKAEESYKHFRKVISLQPYNAQYMDSFAWILATNPESTKQETEEAVKLASRAVELTDGKNGQPIDTLAAAYAANGNFTKAITNAEKAMQLAGENEELKKDINGRTELYKAKQPFTK